MRNTMAADFTEMLQQRYECCKKYAAIGGQCIKKFVIAITVFDINLNALFGLEVSVLHT
jgi:hypothetical protein